MKKDILKKFLPVFILFLVAFLFFLPNILTQSIPYAGDFSGSDLTELNLPLRYLSADSIRHGQIPLWSEYLSNGFPILAEGQSGVFYPLNILFVFLPFIWAINLSFVLNFFLGAWFAYLFFKILRVSRSGSVFAALAFAFSGFFIFRLKHFNMINAAIWLPLELYFIERFILSNRKYKWLVGLALALTAQFFAGHPQISYISILSIFFYHSVKYYFSIGGFKKIEFINLVKNIFLPWILLGFIVFGLCAVQFFPTYELSKIASRQQWMNFDNSTINVFPPRQFLTVFDPYLFGNPAKNFNDKKYDLLDVFWENNCYVGFLTAIFSILALCLLWKKDIRVKVFALMLIFSTFFILGKYNLLYMLVWFLLPGLKSFRFSQRFLLPFILFFACLGGVGFDYVIEKFNKLKDRNTKIARSKLFFTALPFIFILILLTDLYFISINYIGSMPIDYFSSGKTVEFLKQDKSIWRYQSVNWEGSWSQTNNIANGWLNYPTLMLEHKELIQPNLNLLYNFSSVDDRAWQEGGQISQRLSIFWTMQNEEIKVNANDKTVSLSDSYLKLAGMQNVKYFLSFYELKNQNLKLIKEISQNFLPAVKIYENKFFLNRTYIVFKPVIEEKEKNIINRIANASADYSQEVILEKKINLLATDSNVPAQGQAEIIDIKPEKIEIAAELSAPGILFLSQTNYPGWQVTVDGKESSILTANYAFSAVALEPGTHKVIFKFKPKSFEIGAIITIISLVLVMIYFIYLIFFYLFLKYKTQK